MAYDWSSNRVLLYGGYGTANHNDTWAWNGTTWTKLSPKASPPLKSRAGFVSIKKSKEIVMYGGTTTTSTTVPASDMWKWDGSNWAQVKQTGGPISGVAPGMAYDELREVIVFYGGHNAFPRAETYEYDGANWAKRTATSPGSRSGPAMGYIAVLKKTITFGGYTGKLPMMDDTFEYQTDKVAAWATSGTGCTTSTTGPAFTANNLPWAGATFDVSYDIKTGTAPLMILGFSKTTWGAIPLPLNLAGLGWAKCNLMTSVDLILPGNKLLLPIPTLPAILGNNAYLQGLVFDASLQLSTTNLGTMTIGAR